RYFHGRRHAQGALMSHPLGKNEVYTPYTGVPVSCEGTSSLVVQSYIHPLLVPLRCRSDTPTPSLFPIFYLLFLRGVTQIGTRPYKVGISFDHHRSEMLYLDRLDSKMFHRRKNDGVLFRLPVTHAYLLSLGSPDA